MKMSQMLGRRIKEDPKDAKTISHKFLIRGGYIRPVSSGYLQSSAAGNENHRKDFQYYPGGDERD